MENQDLFYRKNGRWVKKDWLFASDAQIGFIAKLCKTRNISVAELDEMAKEINGNGTDLLTKKDASALIERLKDMPIYKGNSLGDKFNIFGLSVTDVEQSINR